MINATDASASSAEYLPRLSSQQHRQAQNAQEPEGEMQIRDVEAGYARFPVRNIPLPREHIYQHGAFYQQRQLGGELALQRREDIWLRARLWCSLGAYAFGNAMHCFNAFGLIYAGHERSALLIALSLTCSFAYVAVLQVLQGELFRAVAALAGLSLFVEAVPCASGRVALFDVTRVEAMESLSWPLTQISLMFVYLNMILFGDGVDFVDQNGDKTLQESDKAFSGIPAPWPGGGGGARRGAVYATFFLSGFTRFCCFVCCCTVALMLVKSAAFNVLQATGGVRELLTKKPSVAAFFGCLYTFYVLDIYLRILTLMLSSHEIFEPYAFLAVFLLQTLQVVTLLGSSTAFLPSFLQSLLALAVSPLPIMLETDETMPWHRNLCRVLLLLRLFEFAVLLALSSVVFSTDALRTLGSAANGGVLLLAVNVLMLCIVLVLRSPVQHFIAEIQQARAYGAWNFIASGATQNTATRGAGDSAPAGYLAWPNPHVF